MGLHLIPPVYPLDYHLDINYYEEPLGVLHDTSKGTLAYLTDTYMIPLRGAIPTDTYMIPLRVL